LGVLLITARTLVISFPQQLFEFRGTVFCRFGIPQGPQEFREFLQQLATGSQRVVFVQITRSLVLTAQ